MDRNMTNELKSTAFYSLLTTESSKYYKRTSFSLLHILPYYIPILLVCLVGNTLVCITIFRNRRMRTRCNYILSNLAIADMGFALATPLQLLQFTGINPGNVGCKLSVFVVDIFFGSAVMSLAAVSLERYRGICCSTFSRDGVRGRGLGLWLIPLIWITAGTVYAPMLFACRKNPNPRELTCNCHSAWPGKYTYTIYACFIVLCTYVLPTIVMAFCYSRILLTIKRSQEEESVIGKDQTGNKKKVIKMLICATSLFVLSWLLYNVLYLLKKFDAIPDKILGKLWLFSQVLGFANSACNPFVYCIFSKNFRKGFKDVFICRLRPVMQSRKNRNPDSPLTERNIIKSRSNTNKSSVDTGYHSNEDGSHRN